LGAGGIGLLGEDMHLVSQPGRRHRRHAAELAAAQHADGGSRRQRDQLSGTFLGSHLAAASSTGASATPSVWRARQASGALASLASDSARMDAASSAALMAPALPIASVPTGTPPGICTIDSRESMPFSAWLSTGTPSTGSGVMEAVMPGRWAAPPA